MTNPFREYLDSKRETHNLELPYSAVSSRNIMLVWDYNLTEYEYAGLYNEFKGIHPELCPENNSRDEDRLNEILDKVFGEENE